MSKTYKEKLRKITRENLALARKKSQEVKKRERKKYFQEVFKRNYKIGGKLLDVDVSKIALAILYLGEGSKRKTGSLMFGNADPEVIRLFLKLLRYCYKIDESKFRCTLQCRADQNIAVLEKFWQEVTKISRKQFYPARVDPRTVGKPSKKKNYKGVCRIDYFSADLFWEIESINKILIGQKTTKR